MGKVYEQLDDSLVGFIRGSTSSSLGRPRTLPDGHLTLSQGAGYVPHPRAESVAYLDLTGSGIEPVAHLRENGR